MKRILIVLVMMAGSFWAFSESRTWTGVTGETFEGEYVTDISGEVRIRGANDKVIKVPIDKLCEEDQNYIELLNPPDIKVEYREEASFKQYVCDDWYANNSTSPAQNHPIFVANASFGTKIIRRPGREYDHELTAEIYVLTQQQYDQSKYHIIAHINTPPFKLNKEGEWNFDFMEKDTHTIIKYNLYSVFKRGEKLGEYIIIVRDERGEIIAYNDSKKWLYKNLDKLHELPVGAWINDKCKRVHPTSPEFDS